MTARQIAAHMDPDRNRSGSFQVFREGLLSYDAIRPMKRKFTFLEAYK